MAFRTWLRLVGVTLGIAALAGASQLGLAYGLGILRLTRILDVTTRDQWTAQLAWVAWLAATAAIIGALFGTGLLSSASRAKQHGSASREGTDRPSGTGTLAGRIGTALAAGLGATVVVPLTMQPARTAQVAGVHPVFVIGVTAGLGALAGVFAGYAALSSVITRWNLITIGFAVWVLAIASVAPSLSPSDPLPAVRLGVFDAGYLTPAVTQRTALFTMPALALVAGAVIGWLARRQELPTPTIALAGLPGPALLTVAYLIAGPGAGPDKYQVVPYWAAMTAAGAGVLGSVLAAVLRRGPATADEAAEPAKGDVPGEPTPDRPPLPKRDAQPESAIAQAAAPAAQRPANQLRPSDTALFAPATPAPATPAPAPTAPAPASPPSTMPASTIPARTIPAPAIPAPAIPAPAMPAHAKPAPVPTVSPPTKPTVPAPAPTRSAARPTASGPATPTWTEPQAVSAPLPQPKPSTPPLTTTPAAGQAPERASVKAPAEPQVPEKEKTPRGRGAKRQQRDGEFVDWVSGLGPDRPHQPANGCTDSSGT
jgi:hypothetical protein